MSENSHNETIELEKLAGQLTLSETSQQVSIAVCVQDGLHTVQDRGT